MINSITIVLRQMQGQNIDLPGGITSILGDIAAR